MNLGLSPLSSAYRNVAASPSREPFLPVEVYYCEHCFLVQLPEVVTPEEVFTGFTFLSSLSSTVVQRAREYAETARRLFALDPTKLVVEIASNDGYLLQHFRDMNIPTLGIDPAPNAVEAARSLGIETEQAFFNAQSADKVAERWPKADLLVANNVLQHVPDLHGFLEGVNLVLAPDGVLSVEVTSLLSLLEGLHFDSIYHESYSFFSLHSLRTLLSAHNIQIFDVEQLPSHGGSLRVFARRATGGGQRATERVETQLERERDCGIDTKAAYDSFAARVLESKLALMEFAATARGRGRSLVGYGAPAKANTLVHYCGLKEGVLDYAVDINPLKQGHYLPGTRVEIRSPDAIRESQPDYVLLLAWNLAEEIVRQLSFIGSWGGQFVVPFPVVRTLKAEEWAEE